MSHHRLTRCGDFEMRVKRLVLLSNSNQTHCVCCTPTCPNGIMFFLLHDIDVSKASVCIRHSLGRAMGQQCGLRMILKLIILLCTYFCSCSINCTWSSRSVGGLPWTLCPPIVLLQSLKPHSITSSILHPQACYPTAREGRSLVV